LVEGKRAMFERYTEKARRVIFFARYEASQYGSPTIETEHLLLGLLREDHALASRLLKNFGSGEAIRSEIEGRITRGERISTSVEMPLSAECKRILNQAAEEAERLACKHVGTEHLLLGLLREEGCLAAQILKNRGLQLAKLREEIASKSTTPSPQTLQPLGAAVVRVAPLLAAWSAGDAKRFAQDFHAQGEFTDVTGKSVTGQDEIEEAATRLFQSPGWKQKKWQIKEVQLVANLAIVVVFSGESGGAEPQPGEIRLILLIKQFSEGWLLLKAEASITEALPSENAT
jgi:uncharacterized protein (TIGR02246 family)